MCEVFNRLKQIGVVRGKVCPFELSCDRRTIPIDDFIPLIHCVPTSLAKMQESDLSEQSAEELIARYQNTILK